MDWFAEVHGERGRPACTSRRPAGLMEVVGRDLFWRMHEAGRPMLHARRVRSPESYVDGKSLEMDDKKSPGFLPGTDY
jgi:hypothetical protein